MIIMADSIDKKEQQEYEVVRDKYEAKLAQKDAVIHAQQAQLIEHQARLQIVHNSLSWRLTTPVRKLSGMVHKHLLRTTRIALLPIHQLQVKRNSNGQVWHSSGNDPQFLLNIYNPAVIRSGGWFELEYHFESAGPVSQQFYIDYGNGFQPEVVLNMTIEKPGPVRLPVYLPKGVSNLRFDPASSVSDFKISNMTLKSTVAPKNDNNLGVNRYLQRLDEAQFYLAPEKQLKKSLDEKFDWIAEGTDPFFLLKWNEKNAFNKGWHLLESTILSEKKEGIAKLYFDSGKGFNEKETVTLPFKSDAHTFRYFYLNAPLKNIRFDPLERRGAFRIKQLEITPADENSAEQAMCERIISCHPDYLDKTRDAILAELTEQASRDNVAVSAVLAERYGETFIARQHRLDYDDWIDSVETPSLPGEDDVQAMLEDSQPRPVFSVVMPVYNAPEVYLRACIDSVLEQSYPEWELCIADDASPAAHVRRVLQEYEQKDKRIRVVYRKNNGHISAASNSALEIARGDFVVLLDHDDALARHALYFMAQAIRQNAEAAILYSDEDKIDADGRRFEPHFKSDWNPDLFFSQNYVSHLGVYKRGLVEQAGGFRIGIEGSQDQDLLLRCLPHIADSSQILHIPRILYHWRTLEGSTALASGEKSYTTDAGIQALEDYFRQQGPEGVRVEQGITANTYRIHWPIPEPKPLVSLLIPTRDRKQITELAVRSILQKTTYPNYEIIIIDNGSVEQETLDFFRDIQQEDERVRVVAYDHPFNYSAINNFGVTHAKGSIIGLVNNDVEVISPEWLTEMVSHACRKDIGCVGAKLYYSNDTLQHGGVILGLGGVAGHSHKHFPRDAAGYFCRLQLVQALSAVTAACLLIRREIYEEVQGLEEEHLKVAFNDVDFCLKVREASYRNLWTPFAELYHHESISRGHEDTPEKKMRFQKEVEYMQNRWGTALIHDPFYSPNLTKNREDFSIGESE